MARQATTGAEVTTKGIGLHRGEATSLRILPAGERTGIVFVRTDLDARIPARSENLRSHSFATTLAADGAEVATVEHLLAALSGLGVTNVEIEMDGAEVPILDGSAEPWVELIQQAGIVEQEGTHPEIVVTRPLRVDDGDRWIEVVPADALAVDYRVRFDAPAIGWQRWVGTLGRDRFVSGIAPARTFGTLAQGPALRRQGLVRGASLDNCVVVDGGRVLSGPLRFSDEAVRHKVLDLVGDLALLEYPLRARIVVQRGGHQLHLALVARLLSEPEAWELAEPERRTPFSVRPYGSDVEAAVS